MSFTMYDLFSEIREEIRELYLKDGKEFTIMFSGGKDSSLMLTLVWETLLTLPEELRQKKVHVICGDTLAETPTMTSYVERTIEQINIQAELQNLPVEAHLVRPKMVNRFFYKVLGKGTPPPPANSKQFRWCTGHLKQAPTQEMIKDILSAQPLRFEAGEDSPYDVYMLLGVRLSESISRSASIKKFEKGADSKFAHHSTYDNILCYHPIKFVTADELWMYLMDLDTLPYGISVQELAAQYGESFLECGLQHNEQQDSSCGIAGSRSGCWVCPLAKAHDPMLAGLIEEGYDHYQYLLDWKKFTLRIRNDIRYRLPLRRQVFNKHMKILNLLEQEKEQTNLFMFSEDEDFHYETYDRANSTSYEPGAFTVTARRILLEYLLYIQEMTQEKLIGEDEVLAILGAWEEEGFFVSRDELVPQVFLYDGPVEFSKDRQLNTKATRNPNPVFQIPIYLKMGESELIEFLKEREIMTGEFIHYFPDFEEHDEAKIVYNKATFIVCNEYVSTEAEALEYVTNYFLGQGFGSEKTSNDRSIKATANFLLIAAIREAMEYRKEQQKFFANVQVTEAGQLVLSF